MHKKHQSEAQKAGYRKLAVAMVKHWQKPNFRAHMLEVQKKISYGRNYPTLWTTKNT